MQGLKGGKRSKSGGSFTPRPNKPQRHKRATLKQNDKVTKFIRAKIEKLMTNRVTSVNEKLILSGA
jgi:hypothetical protein